MEEIKASAEMALRFETEAKMAALSGIELELLRNEFAKEVISGKYGRQISKIFLTKSWNTPGIKRLFKTFSAKYFATNSDQN